MTRKLWVLAAGLAMFVTVPAGAQEKADPPGTTVFLSRYRAWFALADLDKDGYLDKEELAKAFRGAFAKPFDYVPPPKSTKDKGDKDKPDDKGDKDGSEKDKRTTEKPEKPQKSEKPEKKPDYSRYPDYLFLIQLDKDNDEKVSRAEFEGWAVDLAVQLKNQLEAQQKVLQLQQKLEAPKLRSAEKKRIEAELKRERDAFHKFQKQVEKLERHYQHVKKQQHQPKKK